MLQIILLITSLIIVYVMVIILGWAADNNSPDKHAPGEPSGKARKKKTAFATFLYWFIAWIVPAFVYGAMFQIVKFAGGSQNLLVILEAAAYAIGVAIAPYASWFSMGRMCPNSVRINCLICAWFFGLSCFAILEGATQNGSGIPDALFRNLRSIVCAVVATVNTVIFKNK